MPHELAEINGEHSFAYNSQRVNPWHRLGTPIDGAMTPLGALRHSRSNDTVTLEPVWTAVDGHDATQVPGVMATVSDIYGPMAVVGDNYVPNQRSDMLEIAYDIVGLASGEAAIETIGNIGPQGQRFFAYVRFPDLVIDPHGVADVIERGLFVGTSFDGSMANTIGLSNVQPVCANTVRMALAGLTQAVKVKHTANAEQRMHEAAAAVGYAAAAEKLIEQKAQELLAVTPGKPALFKALKALYPLPDADDQPKQRKLRENLWEEVLDLYEYGDTNAERLGDNGWAAYSALTEWWDHYRPVKVKGQSAQADRRAFQSTVDVEHYTVGMKVRAAELILA